jgi:AraC family transcriptional regulator
MILSGQLDPLLAARESNFRLWRALEYANSNLQSDLSLPQLALVTHLSVWHICRLFRHELGISPARCVKLLRMKCAADLLARTSLSVKEIMASVGINDGSHFVRDFRSFAGEFPVEYRARIRRQATSGEPRAQDAKIGQ